MRPKFWHRYSEVVTAAAVWGALCAFGQGSADWPPYRVPFAFSNPLWQIPVVILAWIGVATVLFFIYRFAYRRRP